MRIPLLLLILVFPLAAEEMAVDLNPARTAVTFTLGATLHTVHGSFKLTRGNLRFDTDTGKASGEIVVDAASGLTGEGARDRRMHKEILETARYPEIAFFPDRVTGQLSPSGESRIDVHGDFQLHGASHEMTLHLLVQDHGGDVTAATDFAIPYIEWGLKNPSTFVLRVSDKVQMHIETVGRASACTGTAERQASACGGL
jgi:polyisoprenoid-binding protein YceI